MINAGLFTSNTDVIAHASEIRFIKGRLKFGNAKHPAPFPSAVVVFKP